MAEKYRFKTGPIPPEALGDETMFDPDPKVSPAAREWLDKLRARLTRAVKDHGGVKPA